MDFAQHTERTKALLAALQKADRIFEYNVPAALRVTHPNARVMEELERSLIDHLQRTYALPEFIVDDAAEVAKYARSGDRVQKKGDFRGVPLLLTGAKGKVKQVQGGKITVAFEQFGEKMVDIGDLTTYAVEEGSFWRSQPMMVEPRGLSTYSDGDHMTRMFVEYTGAPSFRGSVIPEGTQGVLLGKYSNQFYIAWERNETSTPVLRERRADYAFQGYLPDAAHSADEFRIIVPNRIKLDEIMREVAR